MVLVYLPNSLIVSTFFSIILFVFSSIAAFKNAKKRPNTVAFLMVLVGASRGCAKQQFAGVYKQIMRLHLLRQLFNRIKHIRELLGKGHAKKMFELISRMDDGEIFHRQLFDDTLDASSSSIAKNITKLKELGVIKSGNGRGKYIVCIVE